MEYRTTPSLGNKSENIKNKYLILNIYIVGLCFFMYNFFQIETLLEIIVNSSYIVVAKWTLLKKHY